jgi:hypothetical protein
MSCGRKITNLNGRTDRFSVLDITDALASAGEYGLSRRIERGECLSDSELRKARIALEEANLYEKYDYKTKDCPCENEGID